MNTVIYEKVKPAIEGLKEMGRVVLLGVIPIILTSVNSSTGAITINWQIVLATVITIVLTALLKGVDKDMHLVGKIENDATLKKGITQF